jgi:hypothetical protein
MEEITVEGRVGRRQDDRIGRMGVVQIWIDRGILEGVSGGGSRYGGGLERRQEDGMDRDGNWAGLD